MSALPDNPNTTLPESGNRPFSTSTTGSPVCVNTAGSGCPLYQDYYTFTNAR